MTSKSLAGALVALALSPTVADAKVPHALRAEYQHHYHQVVQRHGLQAAGCHLFRTCHVKATTARVRKSNATLERMLYVPRPAPAPAAPAPVTTYHGDPVQTPVAGTSSSGGSCGAGFRGLYQFDCQTWHSVGGSGDPAAASPAEQRRRAEILQGQRGNSPWPVCGAGGASLDAIAKCESGGNPSAVG